MPEAAFWAGDDAVTINATNDTAIMETQVFLGTTWRWGRYLIGVNGATVQTPELSIGCGYWGV